MKAVNAIPIPSVPALDYGTAPAPALYPKLYRTALFCGAAPLGAGVIVSLLWVLEAATLVMFAGLLTLMGGVVMLCVGTFCLLAFLVQVCHQPQETRRRWWPRLFLPAILLLANAAVCLGIIRGIRLVLDGVGV